MAEHLLHNMHGGKWRITFGRSHKDLRGTRGNTKQVSMEGMLKINYTAESGNNQGRTKSHLQAVRLDPVGTAPGGNEL